MAWRDLLLFLDVRLNSAMRSLYRARQAILVVQQRQLADPVEVIPLADCLSSLQEAECTLAEIQRHLDYRRSMNP